MPRKRRKLSPQNCLRRLSNERRQVARNELLGLVASFPMRHVGHLPDPFQYVEQIQDTYGPRQPLALDIPQSHLGIHQADECFGAGGVALMRGNCHLDKQPLAAQARLALGHMRHLGPDLFVLRHRPIGGPFSASDLIEHLVSRPARAVDRVDRS